MSTLDIIRKVREAESEAIELRHMAASEAREIIKSVEGASVQEEREAAHDLRTKLVAFHREEDFRVDQEIEELLKIRRDEVAQMREEARVRVSGVVDLIYERILGNGDH